MLRFRDIGLARRVVFAILASCLFIAANSARPLLQGRVFGLRRAVPKHTLVDSGADRTHVFDDGGLIQATKNFLAFTDVDGALNFHGRMLDRAILDSFTPPPLQRLTELRRLLPSSEDPS